MTQGNPTKPILFFALPVMVSGVVQQLYTVVDSMVVGNLVGINAFAAIGATGFLYTLFLGIVGAFAQGAGILFAQRFGAKDTDGLRQILAAAIRLSVLFGIVITVLSTCLTRPVLMLMNTPADILGDSCLYSIILFSAAIISVFNYLVTTLAFSVGDSKTPLWGTVISSAVNIVLDLLFVAVFHLGVAGVAIGTVVAVGSSLVFCTLRLRRSLGIRLKKSDFVRDKAAEKEMLRLSAPMVFRNGVIDCGGLIIQAFINGYGTLFIAGVALSQRFFGIMEIAGGSIDLAFSIYVAQNFGIRNMKRIRFGLFSALKISISGAAIVCAVFILCGQFLLAQIISGEPDKLAEIMRIAYESLVVTACGIPFLYLLYLFRSGIQGMGKTLIPTISGFVELFARLLCVAVLPIFMGEWGIYISSALGWVTAALLLFVGFLYHFKEESAKLVPQN